MSKVFCCFKKHKFAKRSSRVQPVFTNSQPDSTSSQPVSTNSHAMEDIYSQFGKVKPELLLRFGADDESACTMVVWDFGGQRVSCVMKISADVTAA